MIMAANTNPAPDPYAEACTIAGGPVSLNYALRYASEEWPPADVPRLLRDLEHPERWRAALKELVARALAAYEASTGENFYVSGTA